MTRLSDALERAQANQAATPVATPVTPQPSEPVADVPADWHFQVARRDAAPALPEPVPPVVADAAALFPVEGTPSRVVMDAPARMVAADTLSVSDLSVSDLPVSDPPVADLLSSEVAEQPSAAAAAATAAEVKTAATTNSERMKKLVLGGQHDNLLIEQFRRLAAVLHHAQQQRQARTVMIASAVPAEGKSLTATNLALTLSGSYEKRVLLIDADLRRPSLHAVLNMPNDVGLSTVLNDSRLTQLPIMKVQENLWMLPAGKPDPNPTSLLTSPAMQQLLAEAVAQFDWVIIDTPPVGLMPDANLLAAMVDAAFVVVHAGRTPFPLVRKAVDAIGLERVLGVVLNRAERSAAAAAYNYGYYDYYADPAQQSSGRKQLALG